MNWDEIERLLLQFEKEFHSIPQVLRREFVEPFIQEIRKDRSEESRGKIEKQAAELRLLNQAFVDECLAMKRKALSYRELLVFYSDLLERADTLIKMEYQSEFSLGCTLTEEIRKFVIGLLKEFCRRQNEGLIALIEQSRDIKNKISEITQFRKDMTLCLEEFRGRYDLKADVEMNAQKFLPSRIEKTATAVGLAYDEYLLLKKESSALFHSLNKKKKNIEKSAQSILHTIKRRLPEIFTGITPFPDEEEKCSALRVILFERLRKCYSQFIKGELSLDAYRQQTLDLAYDSDVLQIRAELAFRATRLRELRTENYRLLEETLRARRLLESTGLQSDPVYSEFCALIDMLKEFLHYLENPFHLFKNAVAFEHVNETFRKLWVHLEGLQNKAQTILQVASLSLKGVSGKIKKEFLRVIDDLEEVLKETTGKRPNLVGFFEQRLQGSDEKDLYESLLNQMQDVEKEYPFTRPLSFFMHINDQRLRQRMFLEAKELDFQIEEVVKFAKSLQYVKVFDEERVDDILEVFEARYFIENGQEAKRAWIAHKEYMTQAIPLVVEEILLDIGLLDMRALLDIDEKKLQKALYRAQEVAQRQAVLLRQDLSSLDSEEKKSLFAKVQLELMNDISSWISDKVAIEASSDFLLKKLLAFCHLLFETRVLLATRKNNYSAICSLLISELHAWVSNLEADLQIKRKEEVLWAPWIKECDLMREDIIKLELVDQKKKSFEPIIEYLFGQIDKVTDDKEQQARFKSEITENLNKLEKAVKEPLHYLPGCLRFY